MSDNTNIEEYLKNAQAGLLKITECVESAKAAAMEAAESQGLTTTALADARIKLIEITATATQALAAKTQITDEQAVIATKSIHIQKAQEYGDKVRADLDGELTLAKQQVTATEAQRLKAQSAAENADKLLAAIQTAKGSLETDVATVVTARKTAEESAALTKGLADKSATVEERIAAYEKRLAELDTQCANQLQRIEHHLPGATSAGLAHDFNERRKTFLTPLKLWQLVFFGSVLTIVVVALTGWWYVFKAETPPTYDELLRLLMSRVPVTGALVWLALHASRESALAKRIEEDYGYKATIASCFMGFQKQMSEVNKDVLANSPLAKLLDNTLETIAAPPGRIYDKHELTVSPVSELSDVAKVVVESTGISNSVIK